LKKAEETQPDYCLTINAKEIIEGLKGYHVKLKPNDIFDLLNVIT